MAAPRARRPMRAIMLLALLVTASAQATHPGDERPHDIRIIVDGTNAPVVEDPNGTVARTAWTPGQSSQWALTLDAPFTILQVEANGAFDIERPMQLLPSVDDTDRHPGSDHPHPHLFHPLYINDVHETTGAAWVANVTGDAQAFTLRLGLPGPGPATLTLQRDVTPPAFTLGDVEDITHVGFRLETATDEPAIADLRVKAPGVDEVPFPTPAAAWTQTFPVQGLSANTTHDVRVAFTDWSGNQVWSDTFQVTTLPAPARTIPVITPTYPAPDAVVSGHRVRVLAEWSSPGAPVDPASVRFFFDKQEIRTDLRADGDGFAWEPAGRLAPGLHAVSLEVRSQDGGLGVAKWTFTVDGEATTPLPAVLAVAALAVALWIQRR